MVEIGYLGLDEAKEVAHAWLFGNANEFFELGLEARGRLTSLCSSGMTQVFRPTGRQATSSE